MSARPLQQRQRLEDGGWLVFEPEWLAPAAADQLLHSLLAGIPWEQGQIRLFGRDYLEPRLTAWFGDGDYTYSGRTLRAAQLPAELVPIRDRLRAEFEHPFNTVLLNLYRSGRDSMGFHADDEPELGPNPVIASVSLGTTRRFLLRHKRGRASYEFDLTHGSLLIMGGSCQHHFRHAVPKELRVDGQRINLTFRYRTATSEGF